MLVSMGCFISGSYMPFQVQWLNGTGWRSNHERPAWAQEQNLPSAHSNHELSTLRPRTNQHTTHMMCSIWQGLKGRTGDADYSSALSAGRSQGLTWTRKYQQGPKDLTWTSCSAIESINYIEQHLISTRVKRVNVHQQLSINVSGWKNKPWSNKYLEQHVFFYEIRQAPK